MKVSKPLEIRQRKRGMRKHHPPFMHSTGQSKPKSTAIEWPCDGKSTNCSPPHVSSEAVGSSFTSVANVTLRQTFVVEFTEKSAPVTIEKMTATKQHQKCNISARLEDMNLPIEETRKTPPSDSSHRGDPDEERNKVPTSFSAANTAPGKRKDRSSGYTSDLSSSLLEWKQDDPRPPLHQQQPHVPGQEHQHNHSNLGRHGVPFQSQRSSKSGTDALLLGLQDTGQSSRVSGAGNGQPQQPTQPLGQVQTPTSPKDTSQPAKMLTQLSKEKTATVVPPKLVTEQCLGSPFEIPPGAPDSLPSHSPYSYTTSESPLYQHSLSPSGDDPPGIPQEEQQQWQQLWEKQQWEQWYYDQWRQQQQQQQQWQQWYQQEQQPVPPPVVAQAVDKGNEDICFSVEESGTSGTQGPGW